MSLSSCRYGLRYALLKPMKWPITLSLMAALSACAVIQKKGQRPFSEDDQAVLEEALEYERLSQDTYVAVVNKYGKVEPFIQVIRAEKRREQALLMLFKKYKLEAPKRDAREISAPETLADACGAAIEAEIHHSARYDKLLEKVGRNDIRKLLEKFQNNAIEKHLPQFTRCVNRSTRTRIVNEADEDDLALAHQ